MRGPTPLFLALSVVASAAVATAGPWVQLPDAVAQLQVRPSDRAAAEVLEDAAESITAEAVRGNLAAVSVLMEVYASLVMRLADGEQRLQRVETEVAAALVDFGSRRRPTDVGGAVTAWTLAAGYDPTGPATPLLREILLPPVDAEEGATWRSPIDGGELVYLAPARVRVGCSENDRRCRDNEVFFRWVETPGLWVERLEVSNARYRLCVDSGHCSPPEDDGRYLRAELAEHPVVGVSWRQARKFAGWLGRGLPSESLWERTARAADGRGRYPWGNARRPDLANVWNETTGSAQGLLRGGSFPATGPGFYDLAGSVWEWCEDRYQPGLKQLPRDGSAVEDGVGRVVRGGSWRRTIDLATVSTRSWYDEDYRADDVGFRCIMRPSHEVTDAEVVAIAGRSFAFEVEPGQEFVGASVSTEDRRYLERRAITWLLLEKRIDAAALEALSLLRREPRDTVALDVLDRVPDAMSAAARGGHLELLANLGAVLDQAATLGSRFGRRQRDAQQRVVEALLACGQEAAAAGDTRLATRCYKAGVEIAPGDSRFRSGLTSLMPRTAQVRISATDGRPMVWVPTGVYRIGASPGDRQAVPAEFPSTEFAVDGFWIDRDEVSNAAYRDCVNAGACTLPAETSAFDDPNRANAPVLHVSWFQAREYAAWSGKRLPTEVEWEAAARAGSSTRFPWGDDWRPGMANIIGADDEDRWGAESPVGSFPANVWGIHDLIGNASEWVADVYHSNLAGMPRDGRPWEQESGPISERERVVRGGSFNESISRQRVSHRSSHRPENGGRAIGFRCAMD